MTVTRVGTAVATGTNGADPAVNIPAGNVGDYLLAFGIASSGATLTLPGIFTLRGESVSTAAPFGVRVADGSEGATGTFVTTGGLTACVCRILRIRGQDPSNPIDFITGINNTNQTLVIPSGVADAQRYLLQMVAKLTAGITWTPPGTASEWFDDTQSAAGDELVAAGATGTRSWLASAAGGNGAGYMIAVNPAPPEEGSFTGGFDFAGSFTGQEGPAEGGFAGGYDFSGTFVGEAPGVASGSFTGGYDFSGSFTGVAPPDPLGGGDFTPGGRDRFTARRTPRNRRRSR